MPKTDEELQKLTLLEVPDEDLDRWSELFKEKFHPQEEHDAAKTLPQVSRKDVSGG